MNFRHQVTELTTENGSIAGVKGNILEMDDKRKEDVATNRTVTGQFEYKAQNIIIASGGIGANHELVRKNWPERLGRSSRKYGMWCACLCRW